MAPSRVLIVSTASGYGGAERSVEVLAADLQDRCVLTVIAQHPAHVAALRSILRPPARLIVAPNRWGRRYFWLNVLRFCLAYVDRIPEAVIANTEGAARVVGWAARLLAGVSELSWIYVRDFQWRSFGSVLSCLPTARVLLPSPAVLDRPAYLAPYLRPRGPLYWMVVPDPVRLPKPWLAADPTQSGAPYLLHLATVNPWKGHTHLIAAARRLRERGRPIKVISRGGTDGEEIRIRLDAQIAASALNGSFVLGPLVADPADLLRACRGVVVSSISQRQGPESFGRTVIEAWAYRKPVVAFAAGGVNYLIEHERDGLLVPEGDEEALAEALDRLWRDEALGRRLGEAGYAKVCRTYEAGRVASALLGALAGPAANPIV